jgi:hypothetical protein
MTLPFSINPLMVPGGLAMICTHPVKAAEVFVDGG